jgi:hypothetical protein
MVALVMSYIVLPLVGLRLIPESSGWLSLVLMHAAYGLGLAAIVFRATRVIVALPAEERRKVA